MPLPFAPPALKDWSPHQTPYSPTLNLQELPGPGSLLGSSLPPTGKASAFATPLLATAERCSCCWQWPFCGSWVTFCEVLSRRSPATALFSIGEQGAVGNVVGCAFDQMWLSKRFAEICASDGWSRAFKVGRVFPSDGPALFFFRAGAFCRLSLFASPCVRLTQFAISRLLMGCFERPLQVLH